jgi:hypothetical protein
MKLSLSSSTFHSMKTYEGLEVEFRVFLNSTLDGDEWWGSRSGRFNLGKVASGAHWIWNWVSMRDDLVTASRKFPAPGGNRTLISRPFSPLPSHCADWAVSLAHQFYSISNNVDYCSIRLRPLLTLKFIFREFHDNLNHYHLLLHGGNCLLLAS